MPPRARASSVSAPSSRRSTRAPPTPKKAPAPASKPTPKKPRTSRAASVPIKEASDESDAEEEESKPAAAANGKKRGRASSAAPPTPRKAAAAPREVKPKIRKPPVVGINAHAQLWDTFPAREGNSSVFSGQLTLASAPAPEDAPRTAFVFGNGDMGQHGLGEDDNALCEIKRPRLHKAFEELISEGGAWKNGIAQLECGGMHTLAIDAEGQVWSWGVNDGAALGRNTAGDEAAGVTSESLETKPMLVEGLQDGEFPFKAVRVAAGDSVSLAIGDHGELRCWGSYRASEGILGFNGAVGSSLRQLKPVALPGLANQAIVQVATGDDHFLALTSTGHVYACGNGEQNQLGRKIIQRHKTHGLTPERLFLKNVVLVGAGAFHSFAVTAKGEVYAWGLNTFHQTGVAEEDGGWEDVIATPTLVRSFVVPKTKDDPRVVQISGGVHHSVFLLSNGEVRVVGRCDGSEIGLKKTHPQLVEVAERKEAALKIRREREVVEKARLEKEFKEDQERELEEGETPPPVRTEAELAMEVLLKSQEVAAQACPLPNDCIPVPTKLEFFDDEDEDKVVDVKVVQITTGSRHSFALSAEGKVYGWGLSPTNELGLGDEDEAEFPTHVKSQALGGFKVTKVATGGQHSVVLAYRGEGAKPSIH